MTGNQPTAHANRVQKNVPATMRDGTVLKADVFSPAADGSYPVLVCRTPYGKYQARYQDTAETLASRGYIAVVQDIRGRYESEGEFENCFYDNAKTHDASDGFDTIEWAAALAESDGQVGTWGHSYPSWCIWRLAPTRPPHLKAIFASGMAARELDLTFGLFETGRRLEWTYMMAADARKRVGGRDGPLTPEEAEQQWLEVERGKWIWFLPLGELPDHLFSTTSQYLTAPFHTLPCCTEPGAISFDLNCTSNQAHRQIAHQISTLHGLQVFIQ